MSKSLTIRFDTRSVTDYETFLKVRRCPVYHFSGNAAVIPQEYASQIGVKTRKAKTTDYQPVGSLFDYQRDITQLAIAKRKFAVFADCGLGKTLMLLEYARHCAETTRRKVLIVSPLMVCRQTVAEAERWYDGTLSIGRIVAADLQDWMTSTDGVQIGVTNYEAIREGLTAGRNLAGLILDESSMLKSHYGAWGTRLIEIGRGLEWKLCCTGTPAPNDRIEFANHAVFLDRARTVNEFLATYFINRGETQNRWELKPHALRPFYRSLADWSIFLTNPATYGWSDNVGVTPPIRIHIDHIELTDEQRKAAQKLTGSLITNTIGGIGERGKLSQIAKGKGGIATLKPEFIRKQVESWPDESTIIWCHYNDEQEQLEKMFPEAVSIKGDTPQDHREAYIDYFQGRLCRCEMLKKTKRTCNSTIATTNTDGSDELKSSETHTTQNDDSNMRMMKTGATKLRHKSKTGRAAIKENGSSKESDVTDLQSSDTKNSCIGRAESAQYADQDRRLGMLGHRDFISTTVTQQDLSEDCSADHVISESASSKTIRNCSKPPQCTCEDRRNRGRILISKPKLIGFGLNLQVCTRQIFSGLKDSYEEFYQAVKRSNRIGSTKPLDVHIPVTELEVPFVDNVLRKAHRVESDTIEQEALFKEIGHAMLNR